MLKAVNLGEDTDTVAAVAGGLAGIFYGCENIPAEWIAQIARKDYIEELSNKLYRSLLKGRIEKLTEFIPYFANANKENVCNWDGGEKLAENSFSMSHPVYEQTIRDFVDAVYESKLMCHNYLDIIEQHGLVGIEGLNKAIEQADFELTLAILTGYMRQERFCDGLWQSAVEDRTFLRILRRLECLVNAI